MPRIYYKSNKRKTNSTIFTQSVSTCSGIYSYKSDNSELNIYPNPTNGKITIEGYKAKESVSFFNTLGTLILKMDVENERIEIDLGKENSGIYFIIVGSETKKIIKE